MRTTIREEDENGNNEYIIVDPGPDIKGVTETLGTRIGELSGTQIYHLFCVDAPPSPSKQVQVTEYPTVEGIPISDHRYVALQSFSVGFKIGRYNKSTIYKVDKESQASLALTEAETKLLVENWRQNGRRFTIYTRSMIYENMTLTMIQDNERDKGVFAPTITFKETRIAKLEEDIVQTFDKAKTTQTGIKNTKETNSGADTKSAVLGSVLGGAVTGLTTGFAIGGPWGAAIGVAAGVIFTGISLLDKLG